MTSPSSTGKGPWVCCNPAWGLQMTPDVSIRHTIMRLRHRLPDIWTNWNHPHCGLPPGTTPWQDWHIHLKHLWDGWWPSTGAVAETAGRHNAQLFTQTVRNHLRRFTLRARRPHRGPILNRQRRAARLNWVTVQRLSFLDLPHTGLPSIKYNPHTALASVLTVRYPVEHRWGTALIAK